MKQLSTLRPHAALPTALGVVAAAALLTAGAAGRTPITAHWDGKWSTNWGTMTLTQKGTHVTGTYAHDHGKIDGTAIGLALAGRWSEEPSYKGPADAGPVLLQMAPSGLSFTGKWAYQGHTPSRSWRGVRAET
jgi:hypothetical protein